MDEYVGQDIDNSATIENYRRRSMSGSAQTTDADPTNSKLQYLLHRIVALEQRSFTQVWLALCNLANRQLAMIWQLLAIDPTMGARVLLNRSDISAKFAGDVLMVWQCDKVTPEKVFHDYNFNGSCYEDMPVMVNNKLWFVAPGKTDIMPNSLKVDCHHRIHGVYLGASGWQTSTGKIHVAKLPVELSWKGMQKFFTFKAPSLFRQKTSSKWSGFTRFGSIDSRIFEVEKQVTNLIDYTSAFSTSPAAIRSAVAGAGDGLAHVFEGAGHSIHDIADGLGTYVHEAYAGASELVSSLLQGPLQAILNICTMVLVIVVLLALVYFLWRFCPRKSKSKQSNPPKAQLKRPLGLRKSRKRDIPIPKLADVLKIPKIDSSDESSVDPEPAQPVKRMWPETMIAKITGTTNNVYTKQAYVDMLLNGKRVQGVTDSGSSLTLIPEKLAGKSSEWTRPKVRRALSYTKDQVHVKGCVKIHVKIGDAEATHMAHGCRR